MGLLGCCAILGLYAVLVASGFAIAKRCPDLFGRLLASGVVTLIALQATIHAGVVTGMLLSLWLLCGAKLARRRRRQ